MSKLKRKCVFPVSSRNWENVMRALTFPLETLTGKQFPEGPLSEGLCIIHSVMAVRQTYFIKDDLFPLRNGPLLRWAVIWRLTINRRHYCLYKVSFLSAAWNLPAGAPFTQWKLCNSAPVCGCGDVPGTSLQGLCLFLINTTERAAPCTAEYSIWEHG